MVGNWIRHRIFVTFIGAVAMFVVAVDAQSNGAVKCQPAKIAGPTSRTSAKSMTSEEASRLSQSSATSEANGSQSAGSGTEIHVTIASSTSVITLGSVYSMSADIQNVSNLPMSVNLESTQLAAHAILSPPGKSCVWFFDARTNTSFGTNSKSFILKPQDHVLVYFDLSEKTKDDSCDGGFWVELSKKINFSPGNYVFSVDGYYSPAVADPGAPRVFTQSSSFQVGISQVRIVIFAAIGGILAYFLISLKADGDIPQLVDQVFNPAKKTFSTDALKLTLGLFVKVFGAALLSGVFAIISARSSDIKFPITITILDGWGAITIGFLAYFAGGKIIQILTSWYNKPQTGGTGAPA